MCITSSGREMSFWFYSTDSGMLGSMASLLEHTVTITQSTKHFFSNFRRLNLKYRGFSPYANFITAVFQNYY